MDHTRDRCYWQIERESVVDRLDRIETKLDNFAQTAAAMSAQAGRIVELESSLHSSREEIAKLNVKASLIGLGSAALAQLAFVLLKFLSAK